MSLFTLEVKGWVDFEVERTFDDQDSAHRFGIEQYSQNDWRIRHLERDVLVYEYNSLETIQCAALLEINRFERSEQWIHSMQERAERAERAQIQRRRLATIASRQTQHQRQRQRSKKKKKQITERINWMIEGF